MTKFNNAYDAGYDAGLNGADTNNSHFKWFLDEQLMLEWSRGNKDGKSNLELISGYPLNQNSQKPAQSKKEHR